MRRGTETGWRRRPVSGAAPPPPLLPVLLLLLAGAGQAVVDPAIVVKCKRVRQKVFCTGTDAAPDKKLTMADHLRLEMPTLPHCPDGQTAEHCEGGADGKIDIAYVVATKYRKLPRYIERRVLINATYNINPHGAEALGGEWCQLPVVADAAWPTIIGGIGDSGTRGAASLLKDGLNFSMCPGSSGCNKAGDNTVFFKLGGSEVLQSGSGSIQTDINADPTQTVATLALLCLGVNETMSRVFDITPGNVPGLWGWKSPRSLYYAPYFYRLFRGNFRVIHVIRDGRDVATGENQMQFGSLCKHAFTDRALCEKTPPNALRFWAKMNRQVYEYGTKVLGKERYFPLRIEDFVLGPDKDGLINRIHSFLKLETRESVLSPAQLANAIGIGEGHEQSYGGNRFEEAKRDQLYQEFGDVARSELELLGYNPDRWGHVGPALDLKMK